MLRQDALKMRQTGGTLLVECKLVHLDPSWINLLLRALVDHRLADERLQREWREQLEDHSAKCGIPPSELIGLHKRFISTGRLTQEYLKFLWRDVSELHNDSFPTVFRRMIEMMSTCGAMLICDPSRGVEGELLVPARLPGA
ncbi:unnamed protein product, partial [Sphacelaria rigidula]